MICSTLKVEAGTSVGWLGVHTERSGSQPDNAAMATHVGTDASAHRTLLLPGGGRQTASSMLNSSVALRARALFIILIPFNSLNGQVIVVSDQVGGWLGTCCRILRIHVFLGWIAAAEPSGCVKEHEALIGIPLAVSG